ncbi:zf-HC2 domain-containing protein [Desulfallas sp. Bu1-1]|uniref:zf-HC2 domain-containing protein n=1 Tax=Desulfallas sp. Bu1-1 TaxID=2787620 RepID=UPI00189F5A7E|nr:zf-HC2 domain-containing protein [Desulfallas sp. Bu1-1]MBF7081562.1 zf-HC2 domain-containing protein [Desulfallas sp. Bu1-1]
MKCDNYMQELISAWLDGELDRAEAETVEKHLGECTACREHLAFLKQIQAELRACALELPAPEGLSAAVMAQIAEPGLPSSARNDKRRTWRLGSIVANWKRSIAAAAATVLIACGSYAAATHSGLTTGILVADKNKTRVAEINPDNNGTVAPVNKPGNDMETEPVVNNGNPGNPGNLDSTNNQDGNGVNNTLPKTTEDNGKQPEKFSTTSTPAVDVMQTPELVALLSVDKQRIIKSTLIKTRVEEPGTARERVNSLAGKYKASIRLTESQNTAGGSLIGYEITVDRNKADNLISELETIGTLVNKDESSKDIGGQYNKQVEQYQSLAAQLKRSDNVEEQERLSLRMNEIAQQLKAWDSSASKQTIVIWLEG